MACSRFRDSDFFRLEKPTRQLQLFGRKFHPFFGDRLENLEKKFEKNDFLKKRNLCNSIENNFEYVAFILGKRQ